MASFEVHYAATFDGPICDPSACQHRPERKLTIRQELRPRAKGKGHEIVLGGFVCMDCGIDTAGQLDRVTALAECWDEHGWNRTIGMRLYEIAEFHREFFMRQSSVPIWFAAAWNVPVQQIAEALAKAEAA